MMETRAPSCPPAIEMRRVAFATMKDQAANVAAEINWTVNAGEFWVVAGSQRSGKSDFLMLTGGLMPPTQGEYHFLGEAMPVFEEERMAVRLRLGLVFDGGQLFRQMTISESVALPLRYHRNLTRDEAARPTEAMLEATGLTGFAHTTPGNMARNWQKRAGLARALMLQPEVLLLDNPLTGLDARHAAWWLDFLGQLSRGHELIGRKPMTIVATTDDLRPWRGQAEQVACLVGDRLMVFPSWPELERSGHRAVRELLNAAPDIDRQGGI